MQKLMLSLFGIAISFSVLGQTPNYFSYQAVVRDGAGTVQANQSVAVIISIIQGSVDGMVVFSETHSTSTNDFGLLVLSIGSINPTDFSTIDWTESPLFLSVNVNGTLLGTTQLLSVPYALHAKSAETISGEINYNETDPIFTTWDKTSGILITESQISDLGTYIESESDPEYDSSAASSITANDISNWNSKLDSTELLSISVSSLEGGPENFVLSVSDGVVQWRAIDEIISHSSATFPNIGGVNVLRTSLIYATVESEVLPSAGTISSYGFAWSINENPTISDNFITVGNGLGTFSYEISGLDENTTYNVRSWATNEHGIKYSDNVTFTTDTVPSVGDPWEGGVVFYTSGNTGLILQENRISGKWMPTTGTVGASSHTDGFSNTETLASAGSPIGILARDNSFGGFTDWYIPARSEFSTLLANLESARQPGFYTGNSVWTSTELSSNNAYYYWQGSFAGISKTASLEAWLIRKFTIE